MITVLVADDDRDHSFLLTKSIGELQSVNTLAISEPENLRTMVVSFQPDLLVVDVMFGSLNTAGIIPDLKRDFPELKIVAVSASAASPTALIEAGADAFFEKSEALYRLPSLLQDLYPEIGGYDPGD
jgi:CheY-like chemotaxis protein